MSVDLAIIGAGPAGMAAAITAQQLGLTSVLLDEQPQAGGQIYRNIATPSLADKKILGPDYHRGSALFQRFLQTDCQHISGAMVWKIDPDGRLYYSQAGVADSIKASHILIANGAQERPFPIPGWTLPGVMTAGSAQILLKNPGLAAPDAVFAGSGPLLYLIVWQYLQAGIKVKALLDTTPNSNYFKASAKLSSAFQGAGNIFKGLKMIRDIKAAGIPLIRNVDQLEAHGDKSTGLTQVHYRASGKTGTFNTEQLFLHQGIIPNVNLAMASQCQHHWQPQQLCWQPNIDHWGQSSQSHISISGDGGGIGGAIAAKLQGTLAVQQIAYLLNKQTVQQRDSNSQIAQQQLKRELAFRPFLDTLYRPAQQFRQPADAATIVCRCEEVSVGDIRRAATQGCMGPNQLKSFTRCGMGSCQGRQCGSTVSEMIADLNQQPVESSGYYRVRAPIKPLSLAELASLTKHPNLS